MLTNSTISIDDIGFHLLDPDSKLSETNLASEAVQVSEVLLERYVGTYALGPNFSIAITREGGKPPDKTDLSYLQRATVSST